MARAQVTSILMERRHAPKLRLSSINSLIFVKNRYNPPLSHMGGGIFYVQKEHQRCSFKDQTGMTIWTYCLSVRMSRARDLLLTTSLRSYEIALMVGYENSIHFSRTFKEHHGMNPMEFKGKFGVNETLLCYFWHISAVKKPFASVT